MALVLLTVSEEAYSKMKDMKRRAGMSSLSDSEFFIHVLDNGVFFIYNITDFQSEEDLHINIDIPKYSCTQCHIQTSTENELLIHFQQYHEYLEKHICSCGITFTNLQLFSLHSAICKNKNHENLSEKLGKKLNTNKLCGAHKQRTMRQRGNMFECSHCPRRFHTQSTLYLHECQKTKTILRHSIATDLNAHENEQSSESLDLRLIRNTSEPQLKFTCNCEKEFFDYSTYISHKTMCSKSVCSTKRRFDNVNEDKSHIISLYSDCQLQCKECNMTFTSLICLKQHHEEIHQHTPKFRCLKCGRGFRIFNSLDQHMQHCKSLRPM